MENENYYLVIFKKEIIGVINEKELIELQKEDRIKNNKNILTNENILEELKKKLNEGKRKYKKILKNKKQEVTDE